MTGMIDHITTFIFATLAAILVLLVSAAANAATARVDASINFVRVEKIQLKDQSVTLGTSRPDPVTYQIHQDGGDKILIVE